LPYLFFKGAPPVPRWLLLFLLLLPLPAAAASAPFAVFTTPSAEPPQAVGGYANGCLGGAVALPLEGPGFQVIRTSRNRYYGHPELLDYLTRLGRRVSGAGLPPMVVGDLGQPRGGRMPNGHASHQIGLDVDIWFRLDLPPLPAAQREDLQERYMVDTKAWVIDRHAWTKAQETLLQLATDDPRVTRIFVNPAIKAELCRQSWPDRAWLRLLRPYWGHAAHFHVRLTCPADSPQCEEQPPVGPGDGCNEVASWLADLRRPAAPEPVKPKPEPVLPVACRGLLETGVLAK